ncbi:MAG TPA: hypothetical protein VMZ03_09870 [Chitinophagaceae bacterium]|nr:hypothetical protein [Chitinophagaceae bacterium]
MKAIYLITILLVSSISNAQSGFEKQFREIISDTANGFTHFSGDTILNRRGGELMQYASLHTLENTSKNSIAYFGGSILSTYVYLATIAESVQQNEGVRICDEWKNRIEILLDSGFVVKKQIGQEPFPGQYGWRFSKGKLLIEINMLPGEKNDMNRVSLGIIYTIIK